MSKEQFIFLMLILLLVALPSAVYAVSMGNFGETGGTGGTGSVGGIMDKVNIQTKTVGQVVFSHRVHGTNCNGCHPKLFQKKSNSNHVGMKVMERGKSCGACHNGKTAFSVAASADCAKCHAGDIQFKYDSIGSITFPHSIHIDMLGGCDSCHPDLFKAKQGANKATMKDMEKGKSCGACHDGSSAFSVAASADCAKCHAGDILYKDEDAGNVNFSHSIHIEMLGGCDSCHPDLFKAKRGANKASMEDMEKGKSCGACHDGSSAFSVAEACESCHSM